MAEQITESGVFRDCPECTDFLSTSVKDEIRVCVLCKGAGRAQVHGICGQCEEPTYDYGESAWCITCDEMIAATGCRVGDAA